MQSSTTSAPASLVQRRFRSVLLSLLFHSTVLALALLLASATRTRLVQPAPRQTLALLEIAGGSHAIPVHLPPADFAAHTRTPAHDQEATRKTMLPVQPTRKKMSGGGAPPAPHAGDGSGPAPTGNGSDAQDATPAFPTFSPRPPVTDRALLPATEQKIVVDVDLDAGGLVTRETLVKGMGNQLDQIVLNVVRTWRFQPATVNGKPVPSQDELIFPFDPSYPLTDS